jgi:Spy/CpxP family protein refolding chaperone
VHHGRAAAQTVHPHQQPYSGLQARAVKALSDQQIADLRAGRGMGLALPAELNGYPGPLHVLEHADALGLSPPQRERTQGLFDAMKAEAVPLGERLIREEAELDRLFATKAVRPATLDAATSAIGAAQAALRAAHLRYHLAMVDLLTPEQVRRYAELRGYGAAGHGAQGHGHGGAHAR